MKECEITKSGKRLIARITCEIDHHTAKTVREAVDSTLMAGFSVLELDFSGVSFMDSSGIGLIIGRAAKAEDIGASLEVSGLSPRLRRLVCMSGVERLSNVYVK